MAPPDDAQADPADEPETTALRRDPAAGPASGGHLAASSTRKARGRERDEQIRAGLEPLAPGEHPPAIIVAATVAAALGIANVALFASGAEIDGRSPGAAGVAAFALLMLGMALGMLRGSYWFVLAFEALLSATVVVAALSLMVASNALALVLCVGIVGLGGWLFWKLVRVMARMQAPSRRLDP